MKMFDTIGSYEPAYLLADPAGADKIAVSCEPGNGIIEAGTVLYRKASGFFAPAATANVALTNFLVVAAETVDTDANLLIAENCAAYRAAHLIAGKVKLAANAALSDADIVVLRNVGLVFDRMTDGVVFNNFNYAITYKANTETEQEDYEDTANVGATYTVLANSVVGFTAPDTKTFSKWNTAADGSGTDYAAAATYTANADLTLYAVWA